MKSGEAVESESSQIDGNANSLIAQSESPNFIELEMQTQAVVDALKVEIVVATIFALDSVPVKSTAEDGNHAV